MEDPHNWDVSRFNFNFFQYLNRLHDDMEVPLIHKTFLWCQKLYQKSLKNRLHLAAQQKVFGIHIYKYSKERGLLMPLMPQFILWPLNNHLKLKEQKQGICHLSFLLSTRLRRRYMFNAKVSRMKWPMKWTYTHPPMYTQMPPHPQREMYQLLKSPHRKYLQTLVWAAATDYKWQYMCHLLGTHSE